MMFFSKHLFKRSLQQYSDDQLEHISRVANEILEEHGRVIWGRAGRTGAAAGFSSEKAETATHVGIMIGLKEMGIFAEEVVPTKLSKSQEVEEYSKDDLIAQQHRELDGLRKRFHKEVTDGR